MWEWGDDACLDKSDVLLVANTNTKISYRRCQVSIENCGSRPGSGGSMGARAQQQGDTIGRGSKWEGESSDMEG